ncbi:serine hydrolase domain-containing protein [Lysinibacillus sp. G4S2]|uniref:serine hydrolase domain-containing protein n=1 Tax=Lysinibacillus sp. G4S2 TaxID=3055859 RepID=UPI0025A0C10C|nr:serine hydrolase domain-containing protein [Lysinibacillus sp. G4S2]MDM5250513.1 serine hydrolase domain-containing protein [Lysinibacillus sp. G4S2]
MGKIILMVAIILGLNTLIPIAYADSNDKIHKIEQFVEEQMEISQIPGISVVIVEKGKTVYQKGFGYADVKEKIPVTSQTLFELASTSKAFIGLAILQLEKEGLLKRTDDVRKYIPWLELEYEGEPQTITINQLLHQTSGIASNTIVHIPESNAENALELTVRTLLDQPLNRKPGSSFEYATINYDVLGLVIENVSKQSYDLYIKEQLLEQIGMKDSYVGLHQVQSDELATGYKIGFMREQEYTPPIYRGNIPAGYIVSNTNDIAKWLNLQLGAIQNDTISKQTIEQSHIPDQSVEPILQDTYYASGWRVEEKNDKRYIWHDGANPTFSSYFIMQPDEQIGVAILSNMDTTFTTAIGKSVMDLWEGNNVNLDHTDGYQEVDKVLTILCIIIGCLGIIFSILLLRNLWKFKRKQRAWALLKGKRIFLFVFHSLFVAVILILVMVAPKIFNMNWEYIKVWGPTSISVIYSGIATIIIYYLFVLWLIITKKVSLLERKYIHK